MRVKGTHLRELRIALRADTESFAQLLGFSTDSLRSIEETNKSLTRECADALREVLHLSEEELELLTLLFEDDGISRYEGKYQKLAQHTRQMILNSLQELLEARKYLEAVS